MPQDYKEAARWYRKSAEQGEALAQHKLGKLYHKGEGVPQDYKDALRWYRKSAEQGHGQAQYILGLMYAEGLGVIEDYITAYAWISVAKANGCVSAVKALDFLRETLSNEQIAGAQSLSTEIYNRIEANRRD